MAYSYITKKKLKQQKTVEKVLAMIAKENNWKVKHIIQNGNKQHIIYDIPHD
jgi:hypothetical protein